MTPGNAQWYTRPAEAVRAPDALRLLQRLARTAAALDGADLPHVLAGEVARQPPAVLAELETLLLSEVATRLAAAWERGWQPSDVRHVAGRRGTRLEQLAAAAIAVQARATQAATRAPQEWRDQLDLAAEAAAPLLGSDSGARWRPVSGLIGQAEPPGRVWADLFLLVGLLATLRPLEPLLPPPSRWGSAARPAAQRDGTDRDRVLERIRALLAKAESTEHPAEAETFTGKAQELMTRHAVDEALLHDGRAESVDVLTRRIHLHSPYASTKVQLLDAVARANRTRAVYLSECAIATLVGTPVDVDQVEMLFTSLLIQATREMADVGRSQFRGDRTRSFRRSFLSAYAHRIGQRLRKADEATTASYGAELVPLLQRQATAVDAEFDRQFPRTRTTSGGSIDPHGWQAGLAAAEKAVLVAGRLTRAS